MGSLGDAVRADSLKRREEYRKTASWLRGAKAFDHDLLLSPEAQRIAEELFNTVLEGRQAYKLAEKKRDFEVLCANLLYHRSRNPLSIPRNRNDWTRNRYRRASFFTVEATDLLVKAGLIELRKGYGHENPSRAHRTKVWPTPRLLEIFEPVRWAGWIIKPVELVILRDEKKNPMDYKDTKQSKRVRGKLEKINSVTDKAVVQYVDPDGRTSRRLLTRLHCVYNLNFHQGGRFYTDGPVGDHYQSLSEEERKCIEIDGEPTIELDFSGLHPRLLYVREGIQYDDDPYTAVCDDPELRPIMKVMFLELLNSDSEKEAVAAANKDLHDNYDYYLALQRRGLKVKRDLIPMWKDAHKPISKYFCSGAGLRAQNLDAKIALRILDYFASRDIPILGIHDSFIVQRRFKRRLHMVMNRSYQEQTGFKCPIK
jgi:hypothetical protein